MTLLGAPHLQDVERPVHQVWVHGPALRGLTKAGLWEQRAFGMLPAYELGPNRRLPVYDAGVALGAAAQKGWRRYEAEETDDVLIRPHAVVLLDHFQL
eukprot:jgi/Tetstr1/427408/TSEL_017572.t1